ncbi:kinase-like protein [Ceratobasidium sp. AG-I]|nr:kinase-like protein [Ceratobasidium sp. AG-I]
MFSSTRQCQHIVPDEIFFLGGQLEYLNPSAPGGSCDVICMRLNTTDPPRNVAVKCFRQGAKNEEELQKMIKNELRIWRLLNNNSNVVRFLGVVMTHSRLDERYVPPWPVSEYHENNNIQSFLSQINANEWMRFQLLTGVVRGLAHIHSLEIVHGDLKASNIVVSNNGNEAKICDFGSSRICCDCYDGPEEQHGTAQWDSPEIWDDESRTLSSDIWAFGFAHHLHPILLQRMQVRGDLPASRNSVNPNIHPISNAVWEIMQRCWEVDPSARPHAQSLLTDFEALGLINVTGAIQDLTIDNP